MSTQAKLEPKFLTVMREGYSRQVFFKDLGAGILVGIVALPLAIAFGIASGVKPEQGLYTAIIAGFLISLLSGSRVQIGGPTGAFIVIVFGIVQQYGYDGLATATFLAGVLLILMGLSGLGAVIKYIPYPVTVGFTAGIALIIATGQVRDALGLQLETVPADFIGKLSAYLYVLSTINLWACVLTLMTIVIVLLWPRVSRKIPGSLIALLVTTILVSWGEIPVETIGSRFGEVTSALPSPRLPELRWELVPHLWSPILSIALLAGIESLLSAVVADGMTGRRHRSNMELVAQGVANMASPIFTGIPATGAIARTATNIKNGGTTPVSGMIHALTLLLIILFFGKWAALIPLSCLAGILFVVSYNMSEWRLFVKLFRGPTGDIFVLLITFGLTVLVDLTVGIQVGVVLAALLFMRRMAEVTEVGFITAEMEREEDASDPYSIRQRHVPPGVEVFEINGPFFFGAADKFRDAITVDGHRPEVLILRMRRVAAIDATGLTALEELHNRCGRQGTQLLLSGVSDATKAILEKAGFLERLGPDRSCKDIDAALSKAAELRSKGA